MTVKRGHYSGGELGFEHLHQDGKLHGTCRGWWINGQLRYKETFQDDKLHGVAEEWHKDGQLKHKRYYLYGDEVSEEEFRKHELVEKLSGL